MLLKNQVALRFHLQKVNVLSKFATLVGNHHQKLSVPVFISLAEAKTRSFQNVVGKDYSPVSIARGRESRGSFLRGFKSTCVTWRVDPGPT